MTTTYPHVSDGPLARLVDNLISEARKPRPVVDEPPVGSIVLVHGPTGTAYQRHYSDGLWHGARATIGGMTWTDVTRINSAEPVLLVYSPDGG